MTAAGIPDAYLRLHRFAAAEIGRPLIWGETDCASLMRRGHAVFYGADHYTAVRSWRSPAEAWRAFRATGGVEAVLHTQGATTHTVAYAHTGDVLIVPNSAPSRGFPFVGLVLRHRALTYCHDQGTVGWVRLADAPRDSIVLRRPHGA